MLLGLDVLYQYSDPVTAINSRTGILSHFASPIDTALADFPETLRDLSIAMLEAGRKRSTTCLSLLSNLPAVNTPDKLSNITMTSPSILKLPMWHERSPVKDRTPSMGYQSRHSRWREDWEELEHLGEGGFGRVGRIMFITTSELLNTYYVNQLKLVTVLMVVSMRYVLSWHPRLVYTITIIPQVKKIKLLQNTQDDEKIFREVKLLSRLQHRHIVRYYTTWLETPDGATSESSSNRDDSSEAGSEVTSRQQDIEDDLFTIDMDDLTSRSLSKSTSFPSIHFSRESSEHLSSMDDPDSGSDVGSGSLSPVLSRYTEKQVLPNTQRILYIQMVS